MRRFVRTVAVRRMGGHSGGAHGVQKGAPLPAPEEGSLPEKPENDLYQAGDPNYVFKGRLPEDAELRDQFSMTPDEETHFEPAMAARHLAIMFGVLGTFAGIVYTLAPSKPTTSRNMNWAAIDRDLGGHTRFREGEERRQFRSDL